MEMVKKAETYTVYKKRNGRYGVKDAKGTWINGDEKVKILLAEKLIKAAEPKATESTEEASENADQEETTAPNAEA